MISNAVTVTTSPTLICAADNKWRTIYIHNEGGQKIYVGNSNVSTSTGFHIGNGESQSIEIPLGETLHGIVASTTNIINVLTPDLD